MKRKREGSVVLRGRRVGFSGDLCLLIESLFLCSALDSLQGFDRVTESGLCLFIINEANAQAIEWTCNWGRKEKRKRNPDYQLFPFASWENLNRLFFPSSGGKSPSLADRIGRREYTFPFFHSLLLSSPSVLLPPVCSLFPVIKAAKKREKNVPSSHHRHHRNSRKND